MNINEHLNLLFDRCIKVNPETIPLERRDEAVIVSELLVILNYFRTVTEHVGTNFWDEEFKLISFISDMASWIMSTRAEHLAYFGEHTSLSIDEIDKLHAELKETK